VTPGPAQAETPEDFTIEIRDQRGVPFVQARLTAPDMAQALHAAAANKPGTQWVFLTELNGNALAAMLTDDPEGT